MEGAEKEEKGKEKKGIKKMANPVPKWELARNGAKEQEK